MKRNQKSKKWTRPRHKIITSAARTLVSPYCKLRYGIAVEPFADKDGQYLILANHQTPFDQFFCGMAFKQPVYYLATEDIFSNGFISSVIRYLVAPIPIKKQTLDLKAIISCMRVAAEGGSIAIFPEGNRTYSGRTEYINPSITALVRKLNIPVALFKIEGGYGTQPRWSDVIRKGKMTAGVKRIIEPSEYSQMSDDELFDAISTELYVNEATSGGEYRHTRLAEYLERAIYFCPFCGLSELESHGDTITCKKCGKKIRYTSKKELCGIGYDFPYRSVAEWYDAQAEHMNSLDVTQLTQEPLFEDVSDIYEVIPCKKKKRIARGLSVKLYGNRAEVSGNDLFLTLPFDACSTFTVLGRNKLNVYCDGKIYQFKSSKRFNALKYVHIFYRYKNIKRGNENGKFLGL